MDGLPGLRFDLYLLITIRKIGKCNLAIASAAAKEFTESLKVTDSSAFRGYEQAFIESVCSYFDVRKKPLIQPIFFYN